MTGMEGFERVSEEREGTEKSSKELVMDALNQLEGEGRRVYDSIMEPALSTGKLLDYIDEFNKLSPKERGKGNYNHGRSLAERKTYPHSSTLGHTFGRTLTITVDKDGAITLATDRHR